MRNWQWPKSPDFGRVRENQTLASLGYRGFFACRCPKDVFSSAMQLAGKRVTVMGLGRHGGGVGAARYLALQGAKVTVADLAPAAELASSLAALSDVPITRYALGGHCNVDFQAAEIVVVNPAVRRGDHFVQMARQAGATITSELELFLKHCPARTIGVTGANGKSTTAAMTAAILTADGRSTLLGGNIGGSLLDELPQIGSDDWVVLEISSFQLAWLSASAPAVDVAIVTNCTPNHLDWHVSWQDYIAAKQRILAGQSADSWALLNMADAELRQWRALVKGKLLEPVAESDLPALHVPGAHNIANAACAAGAALGIGCSEAAIFRGLSSFRGLPHRLQWVADVAGRGFYDDSQATTAESVMAALRPFDRPVWLLAGGHDKGADFAPLAAAVVRQARGAAFYGAARDKLFGKVTNIAPEFECGVHADLPSALHWCWDRSRPGDVILLSPACASFDQFRDCAHRAETFRQLVASLGEINSNDGQTRRRRNELRV